LHRTDLPLFHTVQVHPGRVPPVLLVLMTLMATWHYVHVKRYWYELDHIVPTNQMTTLLEKNDVRRIPGVGLL
jgi:hypothetical protein